MADSSPPNAPKSPAKAPFPSPLPAGRSDAPSIISSRLTDIDSEDGDDLRNMTTSPGLRPDTASTDAYRPGSALSSRLRPSMSPTTSRRPLGSPGSLNTLRAGGTLGLGGSVTDPSRPGSSTSRTSRTHIPSLASQAFFRPMSSQRLQAQRSARPSRGKASVSKDTAPNTASSTRRNSFTSNPTEFPITASRDPEMPPPPTRGTNYTEPEDRATVNTSPDGKFTFRSYGGSERPLQQSLSSTNDGRAHHQATSSEDSPSFVKAPVPSPPVPGINYQYFSGNTFFCWGGRLQNTRGRPINLASGLFVFIPSILFLAYSGPYLSKNASPAVPFFFAYLFFICMSSFLHASFSDPGILPRGLHSMPQADTDDPFAIPPPLSEWVNIKTGRKNIAFQYPAKYCKTCNIWRPPRCHHCRVCDNCIETQDHHCAWINNCVGRRNYRYFFAFISSGALLGLYLIFGSLGHCLRYASSNHVSFNKSIGVNRVPFAMFVYGILATCYPACLWGYHLWLLARGETTREYLNSHKFSKKDRYRPFTSGNIVVNWVATFMRPKPPTYLQFKARYQQGDQRFGPRRGTEQAARIARHENGGMEMQDVARVKQMPRGH